MLAIVVCHVSAIKRGESPRLRSPKKVPLGE